MKNYLILCLAAGGLSVAPVTAVMAEDGDVVSAPLSGQQVSQSVANPEVVRAPSLPPSFDGAVQALNKDIQANKQSIKDINTHLKAGLVLAIIALLLALVALLSSYILSRSCNKKTVEGDGQVEKFLQEKLKRFYHEAIQEFERQIAQRDQEIVQLKEKIKKLESALQIPALPVQAKVAHGKGLGQAAHIQDNDDLPEGNFNIPSAVVLNKPVEPQLDDQAIIDSISDFVKPLLQMPQSPENVKNFETEYQQSSIQRYIKSYLTVGASLTHKGFDKFNGLVLFLKQPLGSGTNTLVYLRAGTPQHSNISSLFENVFDGKNIGEVSEPAQLKQLQTGESFSVIEENVIHKGIVS